MCGPSFPLHPQYTVFLTAIYRSSESAVPVYTPDNACDSLYFCSCSVTLWTVQSPLTPYPPGLLTFAHVPQMCTGDSSAQLSARHWAGWGGEFTKKMNPRPCYSAPDEQQAYCTHHTGGKCPNRTELGSYTKSPVGEIRPSWGYR